MSLYQRLGIIPTKQHLSFLLGIIRVREERKVDFFFSVTLGLIQGGVMWPTVLKSVFIRLFYVLEEVTMGET